ncbi:hypothetical protein [Georgenia sp. AZ-5]|uniref:hypothetical protein n=1 Tax=Georgenia sp. AZ-5 TaxID=3367526 RepID=UPI0037540FBA
MVSAASGYVVILIAARTLTPADNAEFLSFWALLFFVFGTLGGLQNEFTRAASASNRYEYATTRGGTRAVPAGLLIGLVAAAIAAVTGPLWAPVISPAHPVAATIVVAVGAVLFAGHASVAGVLAGRRSWTAYSWVVAGEATWRLALVALAALTGLGLVGLETAAGAGAGAWLVLLAWRQVRQTVRARFPEPPSVMARHVGQAMVAAASSAALMVGFPALLRGTTPADVFAGAAPLLLAISMTRAPLLMPLNAFQGVAISHFLAHRERGLVPLFKICMLVAAVGCVGGLLAWVVGPWLMVALFGASYHVAGLVLAALTFDSALLGALTITGAATLALGLHRTYAWGWFGATGVSLVVLLLPLPLTDRVLTSLALGPVIGILVHALVLRRELRRGPAEVAGALPT